MEKPKKQLIERLIEIKEDIEDIIKKLDLVSKESELDLLEEESRKPSFWKDSKNAQKITVKINKLKEIILPWRELEKNTNDLIEIVKNSKNEPEILTEVEKEINEIEKKFKEKKEMALFSGKYDNENALLSIYAGAGGVDAQDWAEMLLEMYLKYCQKKGFKAKVINISKGNEAGIKSASVEIEGLNAYGNLKSERGVHRLVRISPYDADKARHTSFALVEVIPEIEDEEIEIKESELKIETFKSSGHGGQSVNTTDSAVRITHIKTGITVTCQNERSQLQNKEQALKILKSRLLAQKRAEKEEEIKIIKGENISAEWGSQIRSYIIHPYNLVKDHRTGAETSNVQKVLDGDLDYFIMEYLKNS